MNSFFINMRFSVNIYEKKNGAWTQCSAIRLAVSAEIVDKWLAYASWWPKLRKKNLNSEKLLIYMPKLNLKCRNLKKKIKFRQVTDYAKLDIWWQGLIPQAWCSTFELHSICSPWLMSCVSCHRFDFGFILVSRLQDYCPNTGLPFWQRIPSACHCVARMKPLLLGAWLQLGPIFSSSLSLLEWLSAADWISSILAWQVQLLGHFAALYELCKCISQSRVVGLALSWPIIHTQLEAARARRCWRPIRRAGSSHFYKRTHGCRPAVKLPTPRLR